MSDTADKAEFTGFQLWRDEDGMLHCTLYQDGMITELVPNEKDRRRLLGFYSLDMTPVPDPLDDDTDTDPDEPAAPEPADDPSPTP